MDKTTLRQEIRQRKRQFTSEQLRELSLVVLQRLMVHPRLQQANTILLYHSLSDEVYTHDLIEQLHQAKKNILLPVVINGEDMEIRPYTGKDTMKQGAMNILEPNTQPYTDFSNIDLIIVPGMSFDSEGSRLGRGKGYYDRFLSQVPHIYKIGICFDFQKVDHVPTSPHDIKMDEVL
ncbi:MAG: 5-formyltetrahydrofolate cyclo-ligase [Prevotellaceae bacterium]|nr:5-formyltetrahydrofolate cyclo-ligase [Prevotellaceae bacterium]MDY3365716.1 5-formyltetrahydrofolate cyclo-ligase [Prevotella sp.]